MESSLDHVQVNVRAANMAFYTELMTFLGWQTIFGDENFAGMGGANGGSLWFVATDHDAPSDYDSPGHNHVGIGVTRQEDVDAVIGYLGGRNVETLFETPRHRDIPGKDGHTSYQVMFESADGVLFEVQYSGPKS